MRYLSLCSGIEAATMAWHAFGWTATAFSEIEAFPSAILAHRYPDVPNLGDMTKWSEWPEDILALIDILVGGTPCQAFSVAGLRNSLNDSRGNLTLDFARIVRRLDAIRAARGLPPVIFVWENVPGVLTTKDNAFGCFLGALAGEDEALLPPGRKWTNAGCVFGPERAIGWRILDAQYFGVAQRRRRVFLVGSARKGFRPEAVLFESEGLRRDSAPRRAPGQVAPTIPARSSAGGGLGTDFDCDGGVIAHTLRAEGFDASEDHGGDVVEDVAPTLRSMNHHGSHANGGGQVAIAIQERAVCENPDAGPDGKGFRDDDCAYTREARAVPQAVATRTAVRRITPREAERLQGFPDDYTLIPWRGKQAGQCPDGPRYKALGNSMAVPCMAWIGRRIQEEVAR